MPELVEITCPLCGCDKSQPYHKTEEASFAKCMDCGLMYRNPRPEDPLSASAAVTDAGVEFFRNKSFRTEKQSYYKTILKDLSRYRDTGELLEIGCASGGFLLAARENKWQVSGVEISDAAARIGRDEYELNILTGDIFSAAFEADRFDVAVMNMVVEHLADPALVLTEVARALRPGGVLWLQTPNYDSITIRRNPEPQFFPPDHYVLFTPSTIRIVLKRAGLAICKFTTSGYRRTPKLKKTAWSRFIDRLGAPFVNLRKLGHRMRIIAERMKEESMKYEV